MSTNSFSDYLDSEGTYGQYLLGDFQTNEKAFILASFAASPEADRFGDNATTLYAGVGIGHPVYEQALEEWVRNNYINIWTRINNTRFPVTTPPSPPVVSAPPVVEESSVLIKQQPPEVEEPSAVSQADETLSTFAGPYSNKFKKYATMTYSVSIYIQSPSHYKQMINSVGGYSSVKDLTLLLQSGGIDDTSTFGAKRSEFFDNDFYIDDVQLNSLISGTATGAPNNTYELNFKVTEPMGLTFLENLNNAIQAYNTDLTGSDENINFIAQTYLMVVRFYGYDEKGNQVKGDEFQTSDPTASVEKFIPFMFTGITFRMEAAQVEYACTAVCPQSHIATDRVHGVIPKNTGVEGETLKDIISGDRSSLKLALNSHQQLLAQDQLYWQPDSYNFEFHGEDLQKAKMKAGGNYNINQSGNANYTESTTFKKGKIKGDIKMMAATAGISIIKFIDLAVRSSTYITDQFDLVTDTNDSTKKTFKVTQKEDKPLKWFKIVPRLEIKEFDKKRNDFAYDITFVISEYEVPSLGTVSAMFSGRGCFNIHKAYDFWFTGNNTEVLDFKQEYNFLYYTSFGGSFKQKPDPGARVNFAANTHRSMNQNTSAGTADTGKDGSGDQASNAASILYSPADQANVAVDIVGDPDWLTQSEIFYGPNENRPNDPIMPDGSINVTNAEIFFSISFNTVVDYNLQTGLADTTRKNVGQVNNKGGSSQYKLVYRANTITTQLNAGKFVQKLEGTIVFVPERCTIVEGKAPDSETVREDKAPGVAEVNTGKVPKSIGPVVNPVTSVPATNNPTAKLVKSVKNVKRNVKRNARDTGRIRPGTEPVERTAAEMKAINDRGALNALKGSKRAANRGIGNNNNGDI